MAQTEDRQAKIIISAPGPDKIKVIVVKNDVNTFPTSIFELEEGWFETVTLLLSQIAQRDEEVAEIIVKYRDDSEPLAL